MKQTDDILRRIALNEATEEEMRAAEDYLQSLEQRLSSQIDGWEKEESAAFTRQPRKMWYQAALAAAACLLLLFSITLWFEHAHDSSVTATVQKDSFDDPEEAADEAEQALLKFSEVINNAICYNTN